MSEIAQRKKMLLLAFLMAALVLGASIAPAALAQLPLLDVREPSKKTEGIDSRETDRQPGARDPYGRDTPRSSVKEFFRAARDGNYERATMYLDLRELPTGMSHGSEAILAHKFKIILDRTLWVNLDHLSPDPKGHQDDGLPPDTDFVGRIETPDRSFDVTVQRIPLTETEWIWQFSDTTVGQIQELYRQFGYGPLGEWLETHLPEWELLGMPAWQWVLVLIFAGLSYLAALVPTWLAEKWVRRSESAVMRQVGRLITGPLRFLIMLAILRHLTLLLPLSAIVRKLMEVRTISTIMLVWAAMLLTNILAEVVGERLQKSGSTAAKVLLPPLRAGTKVLIVLVASVVWLENIGFEVTTLLAGLGVGGIAVALAAQETLKNFLGSIMIMLDKPYTVGQRINVKGHDGMVEEIGIRSTKIRLLSGRQVTIPNDEMARIDVENVTRRGYLKRIFNLEIAYDSPSEKVAKALQILREILENHEGMDPKRPARVYFTDFNHGSLNLRIIYWYHPAKIWSYYTFSEKVNFAILEAFEKEGIRFAFPTTTTYLAQQEGKPLQLALAGGAGLGTVTDEGGATLQDE